MSNQQGLGSTPMLLTKQQLQLLHDVLYQHLLDHGTNGNAGDHPVAVQHRQQVEAMLDRVRAKHTEFTGHPPTKW